MMLKMLVQDAKGEEAQESETLVAEVLEIMEMIKTVRKRIGELENDGGSNPDTSVEKLESLLKTLRLEMVKRSIILAQKHGLDFKPPTVPAVLNGGGRHAPGGSDFVLDDFSKLEEELNRAYRVARETLNNLSRLV
ncbi:MAG: hypothetical protein HA496_10730 [Thaumarchaeota archaeon]|jgi:hypothetical protein|nr:hypothetical protein [Nitrososphaerota archaeon]